MVREWRLGLAGGKFDFGSLIWRRAFEAAVRQSESLMKRILINFMTIVIVRFNVLLR